MKKLFSFYLLLAGLFFLRFPLCSQTSGMISLNPDVELRDWESVSGNRYAAVGGNGSQYETFFSIFDGNYQAQWSFGFHGRVSFGEAPLFAELNDGSFVLVNERAYADDSIEVIKVSGTGQLLQRKWFLFDTSLVKILSITAAPSGNNGFLLGGFGRHGAAGPYHTRNFLLQSDENMNVVWSHEYAQTDATDAIVVDLATDSTGYVVLSEVAQSSSKNAWLFHVDQTGNSDWCKWLQQPGANCNPKKFNILDHGGYVIMSGISNTNSAAEIIRIAPNFASTTQRTYTYFSWPFDPIGMEAMPQGNLEIVGNWGNTGTGPMFAVFQVDSLGELNWGYSSLIVSGRYYAVPRSIARLPSGNAAIVAEAPGVGATSYLVELDEMGTGLCIHDSFPIIVSAPTTLNIVDRTWTTLPLASTTAPSLVAMIGTPTFAVQSYCGNVGFDETDKYAPMVTLFPNPSVGNMNIQIEGERESIQVEVYDMQGKLVTQLVHQSGGALEIDSSGWPSGIYLTKIQAAGRSWSGKWVKE